MKIYSTEFICHYRTLITMEGLMKYLEVREKERKRWENEREIEKEFFLTIPCFRHVHYQRTNATYVFTFPQAIFCCLNKWRNSIVLSEMFLTTWDTFWTNLSSAIWQSSHVIMKTIITSNFILLHFLFYVTILWATDGICEGKCE